MGAIVKFSAFAIMLVALMALHSEAELKISAFNIQIFGVSKMEDQFVVDLLIQVKYPGYPNMFLDLEFLHALYPKITSTFSLVKFDNSCYEILDICDN